MILEAIKATLISRTPYFASAVWRFPVLESSLVPVAGASRFGRIYFNPEWLRATVYRGEEPQKEGVEQVIGVYLHEIYHLLLQHWIRSERFFGHRLEQKEAELWNIAADLEINSMLLQGGYSLPENGAFPQKFGLPEGRTAEWYAEALMVQTQLQASEAGESDSNQSKASSSQPSLEKKQAEQDGTAGAQAGGNDSGTEQGYDPNNGSASDGRVRPWEMAESDEAPTLSAEEMESVRRQVALAIRNSVKDIGKIPAGLRRMIEEYGPPRVPWEDEFYALVQGSLALRSGAVDYTWRRLSRRSDWRENLYYPGLYAPTPRVGVVLDTSGSMQDAEVGEALGEVQGILRAVESEVVWYATDAEVAAWGRARHIDEIVPAGGGGTDMRVGIQRAISDGAEVVVVFTDGYTPWPQEEPETPVVVVLVGENCAHRSSVPDWAALVEPPRGA